MWADGLLHSISTCYRSGGVAKRSKMPPKDEFTEGELEVVMTVFKQYETGLREACISAKVAG